MVLLKRVIPCLRCKGNAVVITVQLEGLRVVGDPARFARRYYEEGADELVFLDIVASLYGRNNLEEIVRRVADQVFIPLTVGGGVRNVADAQRLLRAGADKVAVNSAAIRRPALVRELAQAIGNQAVVVYVEAKARGSSWEPLIDSGRQSTGLDVFEWVQEAVSLGAGEVLLLSVDNDGRGQGYDLELTRQVSDAVRVPVVALGGAGNPGHCLQVLTEGKADAVAAASLFHYAVAQQLSSPGEPQEGNVEFLQGRRGLSQTRWEGGLRQVKAAIAKGGIPVRW